MAPTVSKLPGATADGVGFDACFSDEGAVERAQIAHHQLTVGFENFAVLATDQGIGQRQIGRSTAPHDGGQLQRKLIGLGGGPADDNQLHFHLAAAPQQGQEP